MGTNVFTDLAVGDSLSPIRSKDNNIGCPAIILIFSWG